MVWYLNYNTKNLLKNCFVRIVWTQAQLTTRQKFSFIIRKSGGFLYLTFMYTCIFVCVYHMHKTVPNQRLHFNEF